MQEQAVTARCLKCFFRISSYIYYFTSSGLLCQVLNQSTITISVFMPRAAMSLATNFSFAVRTFIALRLLFFGHDR